MRNVSHKICSPESFPLRDNEEKYCTAGRTEDDNMAYALHMLVT